LVFFPQPDEGSCIQAGDLVKVQIERTTAWSLQGCTVNV
jgi:tRNA-2-methylthio-N6-dimethylallyladenosine synthase